jgi:hypothetical protein
VRSEGRAADAGGLVFWIERMRNGVTDQQLEASLIASPEYGHQEGQVTKELGLSGRAQKRRQKIGDKKIGLTKPGVNARAHDRDAESPVHGAGISFAVGFLCKTGHSARLLIHLLRETFPGSPEHTAGHDASGPPAQQGLSHA